MYNANINLTIKLLDYLKKNKKSEFIFISSSEVYGMSRKNKINENSFGEINPLLTRSCYGLSKKIGENILINYSKSKKFKLKIIRLFHTFGIGGNLDDGRIFFEILNKFLKNQKKLKLYSNGKIKRAYCYISDVIEAILIVALKGKSGDAYNVGNPSNYVTIDKLISTFEKITGKKLLVKKNSSKIKNYSLTKNINYYPSISKIKKLNWKPKYNLVEGIQRTLDYYN